MPGTSELTLPLPEIAAQYLLDKDMTFLNHGSFGACARPVFETYQRWQRELEANPVMFIGRRLPELLTTARDKVGSFLGTSGDNLAFVPNATHGMNVFMRSLNLQPGDEVLSTDHEYGAVNNAWRFNCAKRGARYINHPIPLPLTSPAAFVDTLWQGVTPRTKVISLSHITSPTALLFPVDLVCARARQEGILTVIDGAHAPGQVELDLEHLGADFYTGNLHKWVGNAKGSAFIYARPEQQEMLEPLVVSHGWHRERSTSSQFLDYFTWTGSHDPAAYLTAPTAIEFQQQHDWPAVRGACHRLVLAAQHQILALSGQQPLSPDSFWVQMCSILAPGRAEDYKDVWEQHRIVVPIFEWNGLTLVRVSIQAYNTPEDVDRLVAAISSYHPGE